MNKHHRFITVTLGIPLLLLLLLFSFAFLLEDRESQTPSFDALEVSVIPLSTTPHVKEGSATGFILSYQKETYLVSNSHVLQGGENIYYWEKDHWEEARILFEDTERDLLLLRVRDAKDFIPLPFATEKVATGDVVYAAGYPYDIGLSVTAGIVSATGKTVSFHERTHHGLLQTDAGIYPGNSGGPLFNERGEVVGVNVAAAENRAGIGFSIPVHHVKEMMDQLVEPSDSKKE